MRDTLNALKLYTSPVLFRENPFLIQAGFYVVLLIANTHHFMKSVLWHDGHFTQPHTIAFLWWLSQQTLFSGIATHYWRQVRSPLTAFYPRMLTAEYRAALIVLGFGIIIMMLPMLAIGAHALNTCALEAIALPMGISSSIATPKVLRPKTRWLRRALLGLAFVTFMFPRMQDYIFSAPWFVALALIVLGMGMAFIELSHTPGDVASASAGAPTRQSNPRVTGTPRRATGRSHWIYRALIWQPPWMRHPPVPQTFDTSAPLAFLLGALFMTGGFMIIASALGAISGWHWPRWHDALEGAHSVPQVVCMMSAFGLSSWLVSRRDWPFLFSLGPFGSRAAFARRLYQAHLLRALQTAALTAAFASCIAVAVGGIPVARLPFAAAAVACVIMGAAYVPSLTVFSTRVPRPGVTQLLISLSSAFGVQLGAAIFLESEHVSIWAWVGAAALVPFCIAIGLFAPKALARTDWSIEPPQL